LVAGSVVVAHLWRLVAGSAVASENLFSVYSKQ
jgi:hypothetical protein